MMRNLTSALFTTLITLTGCTQPVETAPIVPQPPTVETVVDYGDCNTAHDAPVGAERIRACPDRDRDGVRGSERCGDVWPSDIADPGEPSTGCVPLFDPNTIEEGTAAWQAWMADPVGHSYNEADWLSPVDCNDRDAGINQRALDIPIDHIDQDCDGTDAALVLYVDVDQDGYPLSPDLSVGKWAPIICHDEINDDGACITHVSGGWLWMPARPDGLTDCRDDQPGRHPGAEEFADNYGDANCDGRVTCFIDADLDGYGDMYANPPTTVSPDMTCYHPGMSIEGGDCNDAVSTIYPQAAEPFNGVDDNCMWGIDEASLSIQIELAARRGNQPYGWRAAIVIGLIGPNGPVVGRITNRPAFPLGQPMSGYDPETWLWPTDGPGSFQPDLTVDNNSGRLTISIEAGEMPDEIVINGDYLVGTSGGYYGWLERLVSAQDTLESLPVEVTNVILTGTTHREMQTVIENGNLCIKFF